MAVPNVKQIVEIPAGGLNIDQGASIPAQRYFIRPLNAFGPYYRVDASGSVDATNPNFLTTQEPEKMRGIGEYGADEGQKVATVDLQAGQRIAMKPAAGEAVTGSLTVEISAEQPFTI